MPANDYHGPYTSFIDHLGDEEPDMPKCCYECPKENVHLERTVAWDGEAVGWYCEDCLVDLGYREGEE